jgi:uncharacterized protein
VAGPLDFIEETPPGRLGITGYRSGGFRIGTDWHQGDLLLLPDSVVGWSLAPGGPLTLESLAALRDVEPPAEILLLGLGERAPLLPFSLRRELSAWGLSVEAMPTPSACRTFNLLLAEDRRVVAALVAMP